MRIDMGNVIIETRATSVMVFTPDGVQEIEYEEVRPLAQALDRVQDSPEYRRYMRNDVNSRNPV